LIFTSLFLPRARGDYAYASFDEFITDSVPSLVNLRGVGEAGFVGNQRTFYLFAQDDWKLRPDLTLNLGVRYEYVGIPRASSLQSLNAVADVPGVISFGVPPVDKNNFAPRIGFAYAPHAKTRLGRLLFGEGQRGSVRANFATTYYPNFQNLTPLNLPPQVQTELNFAIAQAVFGTGATNYLRNGGLPNLLPPANTAALARQSTRVAHRRPDFTLLAVLDALLPARTGLESGLGNPLSWHAQPPSADSGAAQRRHRAVEPRFADVSLHTDGGPTRGADQHARSHQRATDDGPGPVRFPRRGDGVSARRQFAVRFGGRQPDAPLQPPAGLHGGLHLQQGD
jgi:hypothetical protein